MAAARATTLRIGTSGFSYPAWRGPFYPDDLPADRMLGFYGTVFSTVEINNTFYRMPTTRLLADVNFVLRGIESKFIRLPESDARFHATARHPHGETVGMMVAPVIAALHHWRPAKLTTPNHQRIFQQPALLQIFHQRRARLVCVFAVLLHAVHEIAMLIP
jgi:hypothetical protein